MCPNLQLLTWIHIEHYIAIGWNQDFREFGPITLMKLYQIHERKLIVKRSSELNKRNSLLIRGGPKSDRNLQLSANHKGVTPPRYQVVMLLWARSNRNTWVGWCPLGAALERFRTKSIAECSSTHMSHTFEVNVSPHILHHHNKWLQPCHARNPKVYLWSGIARSWIDLLA